MTDAREIKLEVKVDLHTWDELYTKTRSLLIDPVEYPKVEPEKHIASPRAPALATFRELVEEMDTNTFFGRRERARASMNEGVVDANAFPGLGPEAAAMHEAIFSPGEFDMREAVKRQVIQEADRIRKIVKVGNRTQMVERFKSRLLRTWGMIAAIPQTLSVIWTKPPCAVDEILANPTDDIPHIYSYPGVDWAPANRAPSNFTPRGPESMAAFCTPSRHPMSGLAALLREVETN